EVVHAGHVRDEAGTLDDGADAAEEGTAGAHPLAEEERAAARGVHEAEDHAERGRLASAVGAEQAEDGGRRHLEREVVDGGYVAEALGEVLDGDRGNRVRRGGSGRGGTGDSHHYR